MDNKLDIVASSLVWTGGSVVVAPVQVVLPSVRMTWTSQKFRRVFESQLLLLNTKTMSRVERRVGCGQFVGLWIDVNIGSGGNTLSGIHGVVTSWKIQDITF